MNKANLYILREATVPFLALLTIGLALLIVNRLLKVLPWLFEFNLPVGDVAGVLLYLLPSFLIFALPIAAWVGWMVGYGRLGTEGELTALASVGASPLRQLKPALVSGLVFAVAAMAVCQWGYGQGRLRFQTDLAALANRALGQSLQPGTVAQADDDLWLAVPNADPAGGEPPLFIVREPDMVLSVATARAAPGGAGFDLAGGMIYLRDATLTTFATFATGAIDIAALRAADVRPGAREQELVVLWAGRDRLDYRIELHQRLALSFSLLLAPVAAFAAAPRRSRSPRGWAMLLALAGLAGYYALFTFGKQAAIKGWLPAVGLWLGNIFLLAIAAGFIWRRQNRPGLP